MDGSRTFEGQKDAFLEFRYTRKWTAANLFLVGRNSGNFSVDWKEKGCSSEVITSEAATKGICSNGGIRFAN